jgi:hypothetical protein
VRKSSGKWLIVREHGLLHDQGTRWQRRICFRPSNSPFTENAKVKPRRVDDLTWLTLVLLSRWFSWRDSLTVVRPKTF